MGHRNLFLIGTVNVDETTNPLSDKVLDRAVVIDMSAVDLARFFDVLGKRSPSLVPSVEACAPVLDPVNALLAPHGLGFGYVGAAFGETGIWARWSTYVASGHGGNAQLRQPVETQGIEHCRANFRFALLEQHPANVSDATVIVRETFWKEVLMTRGGFGLNSN